MTRRASQLIYRNGVAVKRTRTAEGCTVERYYVRGEGGAVLEHVDLSTELELEPARRETVLRR